MKAHLSDAAGRRTLCGRGLDGDVWVTVGPDTGTATCLTCLGLASRPSVPHHVRMSARNRALRRLRDAHETEYRRYYETALRAALAEMEDR